MTFPLNLYLSPAHAEELRECEFGSWEDHTDVVEGVGLVFDHAQYGGPHPVQILDDQPDRRTRKDRLVINYQDEADSIAYAVASGTFQLYHFRVADRLFWELLPHCSEEFQKGSWSRGPTGT